MFRNYQGGITGHVLKNFNALIGRIVAFGARNEFERSLTRGLHQIGPGRKRNWGRSASNAKQKRRFNPWAALVPTKHGYIDDAAAKRAVKRADRWFRRREKMRADGKTQRMPSHIYLKADLQID